MTITEFLESRVAQDERAALKLAETDRRPVLSIATTVNHPERLLADCAAKRAIIAEHAPADYSGIGMESPNACRLCGADLGMGDWEWVQDSFPCVTLKALAAVYADHPDYQQEWAK